MMKQSDENIHFVKKQTWVVFAWDVENVRSQFGVVADQCTQDFMFLLHGLILILRSKKIFQHKLSRLDSMCVKGLVHPNANKKHFSITSSSV